MLRIGYLDEAAPAEFLDARVEELARIIASNALIAMRGMKYAQRDRAQQARRSRRRPPHRESLHGDKVRECGALAEKRPRGGFEARVTLPGTRQRLPRAAKWNHAVVELPTVLPIRILHLSPAAQQLPDNNGSIESVCK
jgi:hypothetical protein